MSLETDNTDFNTLLFDEQMTKCIHLLNHWLGKERNHYLHAWKYFWKGSYQLLEENHKLKHELEVIKDKLKKLEVKEIDAQI